MPNAWHHGLPCEKVFTCRKRKKNSKNQLTLSLSFDCNEAAYGRLSQKCNKLKS